MESSDLWLQLPHIHWLTNAGFEMLCTFCGVRVGLGEVWGLPCTGRDRSDERSRCMARAQPDMGRDLTRYETRMDTAVLNRRRSGFPCHC